MTSLNKYELIALIEAHGKAATTAGCENNLKGNEAKFKKHIQMIGKYENMLKEIQGL